jgi:Uncharacterized protein conserved in bacteria
MEIQLWHEILAPYELAVIEVTEKFKYLIKERRVRGLYSPIEDVSGRVKSVTSILEKVQKKNIAFDELEERVDDIAGIRIICQFVEDIETVAEMIKKRNDITVKSEKDYITKTKDSGYRSYHMIVYYVVETLEGPKKIQMEIQVRTMAMNFWATVEHSLQYKYKSHIPAHVTERLSKAAEAIIALDNEMASVRSEIIDSQNYSTLQMNLVSDILNNIENLFRYTNKREAMKIQDEFYRVFATDDIEQLRHFHKQLDVIAEGYRAQSTVNEHAKDF